MNNIGYCMKCQQKRILLDRYPYKTKHNKYMIKGTCSECKMKICHLISRAKYEEELKFHGNFIK